MRIHILGICGTFMGGLAVLTREAAHTVTGCDAGVYPPMSTQLEAQGIQPIKGYGTEQVGLSPDLSVIGNVVSHGNPLMEAILDRGLPYVSGPQWLGEQVLAGKWVLAVAGTHGKTTTSSILAWLLEDAGLNPGFLISGVPLNFGVSARLTDSSFFVIEADEYDTAFFDKRSKFVHYRPHTAVLNNLEYDHADIFPDLAAIETQFHHLVRTVPKVARIVSNGRKAAIAAARPVGVPPAQAAGSFSAFRNVKRCMGIRGSVDGVTVYHDFAHHPTAIETTIAGLRARVGCERTRILAVFEPRSNTMKLGTMKAKLPGSLTDANLIFGYGVASGRDALGWSLADELLPLGARAQAFDDLNALVKAVTADARPRRPDPGDEQRRLWRRPPGAARRARRPPGERRVILYLHGFRSSPQSFKSRLLAARLAELGRASEWRCPSLSVSPLEAIALAEAGVAGVAAEQVSVIGSSLGGYYATWLAEKHGWRAVLLNPATQPQRDLARYLGEQPLWHGGGSIVVEPRHLCELDALRVNAVTRPERYYLIAATGDEVLDYREMLAHYPGARTRVIDGSDHGISEFADYADEVLAFCDAERPR